MLNEKHGQFFKCALKFSVWKLEHHPFQLKEFSFLFFLIHQSFSTPPTSTPSASNKYQLGGLTFSSTPVQKKETEKENKAKSESNIKQGMCCLFV